MTEPALTEMLRAVIDRPCWRPWSEAVSALVAGTRPEGGLSAAAQRIYDELA